MVRGVVPVSSASFPIRSDRSPSAGSTVAVSLSLGGSIPGGYVLEAVSAAGRRDVQRDDRAVGHAIGRRRVELADLHVTGAGVVVPPRPVGLGLDRQRPFVLMTGTRRELLEDA